MTMSLLLTPRKLFSERGAPWFIQESNDKAPLLSKTLVGRFFRMGGWAKKGLAIVVYGGAGSEMKTLFDPVAQQSLSPLSQLKRLVTRSARVDADKKTHTRAHTHKHTPRASHSVERLKGEVVVHRQPRRRDRCQRRAQRVASHENRPGRLRVHLFELVEHAFAYPHRVETLAETLMEQYTDRRVV